MDNQEAIRLMRNLPTMCEFTDAYGEPIDSDAYYEAVDIAISALHAQDAPDTNVGTMISRQTAKPRYIDANEIPYCEVLDADTHKGTGRFMADKKDIDALSSVQPDKNVLEQEYLKGWEDGRKNLLEYISRLLSLPSAQSDWNELMVICDNCGHAIHVKKENR